VPPRSPAPDVVAPPRRTLLVEDRTELPAPAASVRAELERQIGKALALAGREDFAAQVERLEELARRTHDEEGLALRVCIAAAEELIDRTGGKEMPGSLAWFAAAMAKHRGPPALGAPPTTAPLPPAGCEEWERVRAELEKRLRTDPFRRWFAPLRGRMADGALTLEAPDVMHAAFVRDNYVGLLTETALAVFGGALAVRVDGAAPLRAAGGGTC
jgi:hypothetical protein